MIARYKFFLKISFFCFLIGQIYTVNAEIPGISFDSPRQKQRFDEIYSAYEVSLKGISDRHNEMLGKLSGKEVTKSTINTVIKKNFEFQNQALALRNSTLQKIAVEVSPAAAASFMQHDEKAMNLTQRMSTLSAATMRDYGSDSAVRVYKVSDKIHGRPRIGLVLGGGGARGAAHVGALKVIEEAKIPIDYISGTSMGAIVGGAYASGLSPAEIEKTLLDINWRDLFTDAAPRADLSFREKLNDRRYLGFEFGIKDGAPEIPLGAFAGRKLQFLLKSVFLRTSKFQSFDELPIPFRAVATNIENGEPVVIKDGSLPTAIRASMSIPGAFPPVEIRGALVDGYVSMNLPIEIVKQMGADIVIAIDVGTPLSKKQDLTSMMSIVNQVGGIATIKNVEEQVLKLDRNDILLRPDLGEFSTINFEDIAEIIPLGEANARAHLAALEKLSVSDSTYQEFLARQRTTEITDIPVDFIEVEGTENVTPARIEARLDLEPSPQLDLKKLSKALDRVQSIREIEQVGYEIVERNGKTGIVIKPVEKSWGPNYMRAGINFVSDFDSDNYFNVLLDHTLVGINDLGAEWRNQVQFGQTSLLATKFYQPLDSGDTFYIAPRAEFKQRFTDIYDGADRIAEYRARTLTVGPDIGINFGTVAELRSGLYFGKIDADRSTGDSDLPELDEDKGAFDVYFTLDQVDNSNFPRHGAYLKAGGWFEREELGGESNYQKYTVDAMAPLSYSRHTLLPRVSAGWDPLDRTPFYDQFTLGGASTLSGYHTDQLRGSQKLLGKLTYYYQLSNAYFNFARSTYAGLSISEGNVWQNYDDISLDDLTVGGEAFVAVETVLGPLYVTYGRNDDLREGIVTISLGQRLN